MHELWFCDVSLSSVTHNTTSLQCALWCWIFSCADFHITVIVVSFPCVADCWFDLSDYYYFFLCVIDRACHLIRRVPTGLRAPPRPVCVTTITTTHTSVATTTRHNNSHILARRHRQPQPPHSHTRPQPESLPSHSPSSPRLGLTPRATPSNPHSKPAPHPPPLLSHLVLVSVSPPIPTSVLPPTLSASS